MLDQYAHFLDVSATASAGFTGLLLVALSIVNSDESQHGLRERRMVLAGSAFLALVDIFFVSLLSSLGGAVMLAAASLVMAAIGLLGTSRLMPRAKRAGNFARDFPKRKLNLMFATVAVTLYSAQFILAIALLSDARSTALTRALIFVLVTLFASALGRGWEVAGIGQRSPPRPQTR